jgi:hypothetical protein
LNKADLCVRVGIGRSTFPYYLRHIRGAVAEATTKNEDARQRVALSHIDLVERVSSAAGEVREEIARLRAATGAKNTSAIFAGYRTLVQIERLVAELIGEIAPPVQNTYIVQVAALLERPVAVSSLSATARSALGMGNDAR